MNPTESNNCKIIENLGYEQGCISKEGRALTMHDKKGTKNQVGKSASQMYLNLCLLSIYVHFF